MTATEQTTAITCTKDEFIRLFESGELQKRVAGHVASVGYDPNRAELRSWNNSYAFMDIVLRDPDIPADIRVHCEYVFPTKHRADMVLEGPNAGNLAETAVLVVELKQWDEFHLEDHRNIRPAKAISQVKTYADTYCTLNGPSRCIPCAYFHNLPEVDAENVEGVEVFCQGDTQRFRNLILETFCGELLFPGKAIGRAVDAGYWKDAFPQKAGELRAWLLDRGLAKLVNDGEYAYEPTPVGATLGIVRQLGYDAEKNRDFVGCAFSDGAMRSIAKLLSAETSPNP